MDNISIKNFGEEEVLNRVKTKKENWFGPEFEEKRITLCLIWIIFWIYCWIGEP